jgi:hypothetical protein
MLWLLVLLIILLLVFGGGGYRYRSNYGSYYNGGIGILGTVVLIVIVLFLLGVLR